MLATTPDRPRSCVQCGTPFGPHAQYAFCGRCAAALTLDEFSDPDNADESLAAVLPPSALQPNARHRLGDYELLDEIARGGMGVIFRARQVSLDRVVAIKVLLYSGLASADRRQRFREEAMAAAKLDHANIVRILDVGEFEGQPFIVMDYVPGTDLDRLTQHRPLPAERAAGYLAIIARAVEFAHQHGVLHRDLKPSNVLLDATDQPRVTDFGLSRNLAAPSGLTLNGEILGSPSFMPPEQASGDLNRMGPASDVYGLGAVLYHLLTGRPPFLAETLEATLLAVREGQPVPPHQLNRETPADLETICLKCLEKEPERRYSTAQQVADELDRFLSGRPIHARPVGMLTKAWRWCQRRPSLAVAFGLIVALTIVVATGGPLLAWRMNTARKDAEAQRRWADEQTLQARRREYAADMLLAHHALEDRHLGLIQDLLERHRPGSSSTTDLRGWEWRYLWHQTHRMTAEDQWIADGPVGCTAWSRDGASLTFAMDADPRSHASQIRNWALKERVAKDIGEVPGRVCAVHPMQPDGVCVVSVQDRTIWVWDSRKGRKIPIPTGEESFYSACLSSDGNTLAATGENWVRVWRVESQREVARLDPGGDRAATDRGLALSPDGRIVACYRSTDGSTEAESVSIILWDLLEGRVFGELKGHGDRIYRLAFSADGRLLASTGLDKTPLIWDLAKREIRFRLPPQSGRIDFLEFSPDSQVLATASSGHPIDLWSTGTGDLTETIQGPAHGFASISFSPDSRRIATSGIDGRVKIWRTGVPNRSPDFRPNRPSVISTRFDPVGDALWTFDGQGTITIWDPRNLTRVTRFELPEDCGTQASLSPGGAAFALQTTQGGVRIYSPSPFRLLADLSVPSNGIQRLCFSPDGTTLATVTKERSDNLDNVLILWNWTKSERISDLSTRRSPPSRLAFARDGTRLSMGYPDGGIELWEVANGSKVWAFDGEGSNIDELLPLSDGHRIAVLAAGTLSIREVSDPARTVRLTGPSPLSYGLAESMDGSRLAVGGMDGTITLWDLATHQQVALIRGHRDQVIGLSFHRDGDFLTSVSRDAIRVWRAVDFAETDATESDR